MILWVLGGLAAAQAPDLGAPFITNYGPKQYSAAIQNWAGVQDSRGVLYFGNTQGILEFDGQRWRTIPTPDNNLIRALVSAPDGTIYYGSVGDFGFLATSSAGRVSAVSLRETIPPTDRDFNDVWQVESCSDGVYFMTRRKIFRFHNGRTTVLQADFVDPSACTLNGILFYADRRKGVCLVDGDTVVPVPQLAGVFNRSRISLVSFGPHELLAARLNGDFRRLDLSALWDETSRRYLPARAAAKDLVHAFSSEVGAFMRADQAYLGRLWRLGPDAFCLSTIKAGIIAFDRSGKLLRVLNKNGGLPDNAANGLLVDRFNDLWVATDVGISHIEWSVPQSMLGARNGLDGYVMSATYHQGRLYVGTLQKLFVQVPFRYSLKNDVPKFKVIQGSPDEIWQFLDVEGDLIAATGRGLFRIEKDSASRIPDSKDSSAMCLGTSKRWPGHLFVGLLEGLDVFERTAGRWSRVGSVDGVKDNIRAIAEDTAGDLWLSTDGKGLLRVHFPGDKPTEAKVQHFGPGQGLPGLNGLRAVIHGSSLYALSPKGLFQTGLQPWKGEAADSIRFTRDQFVGKAFQEPPKPLLAMVPDGKGGFLFSTSEGPTWAVRDKDGQFQMNPRPFQGIPLAEWDIFLHPTGGIWFIGDGLVRVDPSSSKDYDQGFSVLIRKVFTKTDHLLFEGTRAQAGKALTSQGTPFPGAQASEGIPELPYSENALSFEFSATFFEKPGTTRFQSMLEGFDQQWSDWGTVAFKEYTNIPEGSYRFRVRAMNLYGTLGPEAVYSFRIQPPWYRTLWAYLGYLVGLFGSIWALVRWRLRAMQIQNELLESQVADRTRTVERQRLDLEVANENLLGLNQNLLDLNRDMAAALEEVNALRGFIPICAYCKQIRDDQGYWAQLEAYISRHTGARFSHGICPKCKVKVMEEIEQMKQDDQL